MSKRAHLRTLVPETIAGMALFSQNPSKGEYLDPLGELGTCSDFRLLEVSTVVCNGIGPLTSSRQFQVAGRTPEASETTLSFACKVK